MENRKLTLGSLFSGSGGFELGGILAGIEPRWASEIEPFCVRVTTRRLPQVRHLGDIKAIDGGKIEPVDIITFGSPCTNLSIAGKRAGLHGEQSSLFFEAIRVIKEMRCATDGKYPRFIVWENVVGAFSSSQGRDLQSVLTEIVRVKEPEAPEVPMPEKGGWPLADVLLGDGWSVAYRTLDAQYFGVAQRRRRIYLVADFDGGCAGKVLFESEGVSGYSSSRFRTWQDAARAASDCAHATGGHLRLCLNDQGGSRMDVTEDRTNTLRAQSEHPPLVFSNHSQDSRYTGPTEKSEALTSMLGTGGNSTPLVVNESKYWDGGDVAGTLTANGAGGRQRMPDKGNFQCVVQNRNKRGKGIVAAVDVRITTEKSKLVRRNVHETEVARCLDTDGARPDANQGGLAIVERSSYAVTTGTYTQAEKEKSPTLMARDYKFPHAVCRGIGRDVMNAGANAKFAFSIDEELQPTMTAQGPGAVQRGYTVRRLMPQECALLQGFPPDWCANLGTENPTDEEMAFWRDVFETHRKATGASKKPKTDKQIRKWLKNPYTDGAEYRMWGNGIAIPCCWFVLAGIAYYAAQK